ncbi:unnamed protein product [Aspergillus oryzae RIB40]|uniref:DNA, SC001 n=1 Tax=Aspergillus oryzae (strain ATCC 42149 / RIB 40) TaxID=510516 RepID=Q2UNQ8_ASPOR|nr:unnamed protein product [Aspergillus oryzae RIB40]BAE56807.1 unnamed protein product [Aspergillus oryzae RIB40]
MPRAALEPECVLVNGVFQWKHALANGHQEENFSVPVKVAVAANGVRSSQANGAVAVGTPPAKITDYKAVKAPYNYINTLPSKNIRETFIDALNSWLEVPAASSTSIKSIIGMLHHSSLMLDDIEDNSVPRRGSPTAHTLFGVGQTINSANYTFVCAFEELQKLQSPNAIGVFIEQLKNLHCGQGLDLYWKYNTHVPTADEYMTMIDHKTGGPFRLCVRLMQGESSGKTEHIDARRFVTLLGRYFQIRDDYQNLTSAEYTSQKGFWEDLDEGKSSWPLIDCLTGSDPEQTMIKGILQHKGVGEMPMAMKRLILGKMRKGGALDSTFLLLQDMQEDILKELELLEAEFGSENPILELVLRRLCL